jgi:poly(3-hydroxybutyrate) depolymerase
VDVVVGFHGRNRSGEQVANLWALADDFGGRVLGLYPDGVIQPWFHDLLGWDVRSEQSPDLLLFDALIEWAAREYCIDRKRIHVIGHSWGGTMANLVACQRSNVRSVVSVGSGGPTVPCRGPVGAMVVHGTQDQDEPIVSAQLSTDVWSFYNRCASEREPTLDGACSQHKLCTNGFPLLYCEHPGGHGWPSLLRGGVLTRWLMRP